MALVNASRDGGIALFELNAPPANTYSYEMMRELDAHVLEARFDSGVLEGADPYFKNAGAL
jgi:enoyl-CoA hydratase/carnithine racemase